MEYDFLKLADKYFDSALKDLKELIACKSVLTEFNPNAKYPFGDGCAQAVDLMGKIAKRDSFTFLNDDYYACEIKYGQGEDFAILGHLDVVPATGEWESDPFKAIIKNNKLIGRGATDDKGPVIASYYALKMLKDLNIKFNKTVKLILGCDEESESRCLNHYFSKYNKPSIGFSPDADFPLIYGEKAFANFTVYGELDNNSIINTWESGDRVNIVPDVCKVTLNGDFKEEFYNFINKNDYKGIVQNDKYIVYGRAAHGSTPELGLNSNFIMAKFIKQIREDNFVNFVINCLSDDAYGKKMGIDCDSFDMGRLSLNPGIFKIKEKQIEINCDCRTPDDNMADVIDKNVELYASKYGLKYRQDHRKNIHYVDPESELVIKLYNAYKEISGDYVNKPMTIGGGTYAKFIDNCVAFGPTMPNSDDLIHSPGEFIDLDNFKKDIAIYAYAIYELVK